jgi:hypothetical protein
VAHHFGGGEEVAQASQLLGDGGAWKDSAWRLAA